MTDSINRFTRTVENYVKYRPHYPFAIIELLQKACQLTPTNVIADIASGTGFLAEIFLQHGNPVFGVEPNADMRTAGQQYLRQYPRFTSIAATAEATTLGPHSVDIITAGQAFHWFDPKKSRQEFARILKPDGWVILVWNMPGRNTPFMMDYEQQIWFKYLAPLPDKTDAYGQTVEAGLQAWYAPSVLQFQSFDNYQVVDYEGLKGRILSSSFSPTPEDPKYAPLLEDLKTIFERHQVQGKVTIEYECQVCYGQFHQNE